MNPRTRISGQVYRPSSSGIFRCTSKDTRSLGHPDWPMYQFAEDRFSLPVLPSVTRIRNPSGFLKDLSEKLKRPPLQMDQGKILNRMPLEVYLPSMLLCIREYRRLFYQNIPWEYIYISVNIPHLSLGD